MSLIWILISRVHADANIVNLIMYHPIGCKGRFRAWYWLPGGWYMRIMLRNVITLIRLHCRALPIQFAWIYSKKFMRRIKVPFTLCSDGKGGRHELRRVGDARLVRIMARFAELKNIRSPVKKMYIHYWHIFKKKSYFHIRTCAIVENGKKKLYRILNAAFNYIR